MHTFSIGKRLAVLNRDDLSEIITVEHHKVVELSEQVRSSLQCTVGGEAGSAG
jgi:hypothetical protein